MFHEQSEYEILTPAGFKNFKGVQSVKKSGKIVLDLCDGKHVECSILHQFLTESGWKKAVELTFDDKIKTENDYVSLFNIDYIEGEFEFLDVVGVEAYQFYSNGVVSHNCEFLGSTNTLISGQKLARMAYVDPIAEHDKINIYEMPIKEDGEKNKTDHLYAICVDVSEGKNMDSSAFCVLDISAMPYRLVATYHSSSIHPVLFPTVIYNAARLFNDAYVLVEINNTPQVADILHNELEYENLWKVFTGNKKPQQLSAGFARGVQLGIKMSPQVKRIGCSNLKMLIEGDKMVITDFDVISELTTFVQDKNSFAAESGSNDDLIMCLVTFAWVTTQKYFKEIVSHDIRKQFQVEHMNQIDDETLPEPIIEDGLNHGLELIDGDLWDSSVGGDTYGSFIRDMMKNI
jgi:hypothetical protein